MVTLDLRGLEGAEPKPNGRREVRRAVPAPRSVQRVRQRGRSRVEATLAWVVKSARGAVPVFRPVRFLEPLPEPAVRLSTQRALHKCGQYSCDQFIQRPARG